MQLTDSLVHACWGRGALCVWANGTARGSEPVRLNTEWNLSLTNTYNYSGYIAYITWHTSTKTDCCQPFFSLYNGVNVTLLSTFTTLIYICINHGDRRFFQFKIIIDVLVRSFCLIWIFMLCVYDIYKDITLSVQGSTLDVVIYSL